MKRQTKVVKSAAADIEESLLEENPESAMSRIALKMAVYCNKNITTKELIMWQIKAADLVADYREHKNYDKVKCTSSFLACFGSDLIPALLDAKTSKERKKALQGNLVGVFQGGGYQNCKECIEEIGNAFLSEYARLSGEENSYHQFIRVLSCIMVVSEMYGDYEFYDNEGREARKWNTKQAESEPASLDLRSFISDHAN